MQNAIAMVMVAAAITVAIVAMGMVVVVEVLSANFNAVYTVDFKSGVVAHI